MNDGEWAESVIVWALRAVLLLLLLPMILVYAAVACVGLLIAGVVRPADLARRGPDRKGGALWSTSPTSMPTGGWAPGGSG